MTKEDALFFLGRFRTKGINEKLYDALGVAIEALRQPEIIYCEDCKHWEQESICDGYCDEIEKGSFDEDHFCGYAERREDGTHSTNTNQSTGRLD